jgi:signal transduction histidine kinase
MNFPGSWPEWVIGGAGFALLIVVAVFLASVAIRKFVRRSEPKPRNEFEPAAPRSEDQAAFMTASMQSVIQRLREQEKELGRLHRQEKDRAQQTERLIAAVAQHMPTGLLLINAAGLITTANPAAETVLGAGALGYRRFSEALGANSRMVELITQCLRDGATFQREEVEHTTPAGELRHLGVTISPVFPPQPAQAQQRAAGALCLLSDLTELTALQKQVRLKESLAALGEMSAGIAHEFKNALAIISGYAQMIRSEAGAADMAESAAKIEEETRALTHVVTEFLRFARPLAVAHENVLLAPLVERVVTEVREVQPGVEISLEGEFAEVTGDEDLLRQALRNLVRNAAEAAGEGAGPGRVVVSGSLEDAAGQRVQRIAVADNGPGITPQDLPKVFVPFFTTKADGTGLGLAVVQKIALQHGGGVEARNRPEGGAEFMLWLPLARAEPQAVESASDSI